MVMGMVWII